MSLPKTYSLALSGWRHLAGVAELFLQNQGLVFLARACSRLGTCPSAVALKLRSNCPVTSGFSGLPSR